MLPSLAELTATARVVALPLVTRFRGITVREALLIEGPNGWAEFSPFLEYGDVESSAWLQAAIEDAYGASPTLLRDQIPVNATVPAVAAADVPAVLARFGGARTAKVKVAEPGGSLEDDVARVAAVRRQLGDGGAIRVDANGGWSLDQAEAAILALAPYRLEYAEQPCASIEELAELRGRIAGLGVLIAADESVRKQEDPLRVARAGAADLLIVKAQPLGGAARALRIVAEAGLPAVVSSAIDTSVGLSLGARLAAAMPGQDLACGLGTAALLGADVTSKPLLPVDGHIPATRVSAERDALDATAASADRTAWWLDRLARCHRVLAESETASEPG